MPRIPTVLFALVAALLGCTWTPQQARVASSVLNGVACGVAAAQETPCTPQAVLDALARDTESQQAKIKAVVPQAEAVDQALTKTLVEQLAANTAANAALAKVLVELAARAQPAALPQYPLTMEPMPALPPPRAPPPKVSPVPSPLPPPAPDPEPPTEP